MACAREPAPSPPDPGSASAASPAPAARSTRVRIDGRSFPDKALALTWDDGPDEGTVELASYLHARHVRATFFVVGAWVSGLSSDPGEGRHVFQTGHETLHVLAELQTLGHHVGNHTRNHVLLSDAPAATVVEQLRENDRRISYPHGAMHLFRAPGGAWSEASSAAVDADPELTRLVGPVHWDIDGKDWEGSLYCRSEHPEIECENAAPGGRSRVKPAVIAKRYLALVESQRHGIVLLHDRVGHVGSDYALAVARALVPELQAKGYVFVAPVLRFAPLASFPLVKRAPSAKPSPAEVAEAFGSGVDPAMVRLGDINGDGRADACARIGAEIVCALSDGHSFLRPTPWFDATAEVTNFELVDVDGDGRADLCVDAPSAMRCGVAP
jgi:peptidoglycan/xylan/chitin deacetylase (PgdA/CDA1 family)